MSKFVFIILSTLLISFFPLRVNAQEKGDPLTSQVNKLRQLFQTRDPLKENLMKVNEMQKEFSDSKKGIDPEASKILAKLKNPFLPQLPKPKKPEIPVEDPEPIVVEDPQAQAPVRPAPVIQTQPAIKRPPPDFTLNGVVWNTDRPQAIINGQVVGVGGVINDWTVINITRDGVEVNFEDEILILEP